MKTLTVQKISYEELTKGWKKEPVIFRRDQELFIRCNKKGEINWDKAPVYTWPEIQEQQLKRPVHFSAGPPWEL
jgi:hypothetical protein